MNVNRDVITDLLPLYLAGEASAGTRALVEEYLRDHPDFAAEMRSRAERSTAPISPAPVPLAPDHEKATLERIRHFNRRRNQLRGVAIALTVIPFTVGVDDRINWVMLRDNPTQAVMFWIAAVACLIGYSVMGRRLRNHSI